ncbi:unnamed protein product, partial [Allacma fusca]
QLNLKPEKPLPTRFKRIRTQQTNDSAKQPDEANCFIPLIPKVL